MIDRTKAIQVIAEASTRPFVRGEADCFRLAMDVVEAVTGRPAPYRADVGKYRSLSEGLRLMTRRGFSDLGDALAAVYRPIAPGEAVLGDLAVPVGLEARHCVFVFDGQDFITLMDTGGVGRVPVGGVGRCFRVG